MGAAVAAAAAVVLTGSGAAMVVLALVVVVVHLSLLPAVASPVTRLGRGLDRRRRGWVGRWAERLDASWAGAATISAFVAAAVVGPAIWRMAHGRADGTLANDWVPHVEKVHELGFWPPVLPIPHFFFPLVAAIVRVLLGGSSAATASAVVGIVGVGASAATIVWFLRRPWSPGSPTLGSAACAVTAVLFTVSELPQILVFRGQALTFDRLNTNLHQWNTPTNVVVESLQLVMFVWTAELGRDDAPTPRRLRALAAVSLLATLALPAIPIALLVATPIWLWRRGRLDRLRSYALAVVVPVVIGLGLESLESILWLEADLQTHPGFRLGGSLAKLPLWGPGLGVLVPPAIALLLGWRTWTRNPEVQLVGWSLLGAMAMLLTIAFDGPRENEGNVGRIAFAVGWIGYLYLVRWVLEIGRDLRSWRSWSRRRQVAIPVVAVYLVLSITGGALLLLEQAGVITFTGTSI